jgi:flagellar export protein FliJ
VRRFRFSLEPALRHRQRQEEQAQIELAAQQRRREHEVAAAEALRLALRRHDERRAALQMETVDIGVLADAERYAQALIRELTAQEQRVSEAVVAVETYRAALLLRRTECEALERLRGQRLTEHRTEQLRSEQQTLDESSVLRWRRQS